LQKNVLVYLHELMRNNQQETVKSIFDFISRPNMQLISSFSIGQHNQKSKTNKSYTTLSIFKTSRTKEILKLLIDLNSVLRKKVVNNISFFKSRQEVQADIPILSTDFKEFSTSHYDNLNLTNWGFEN